MLQKLQAILDAIRANDQGVVALLEEYVGYGYDLNYYSASEKTTILITACQFLRCEVVRWLVAHNVDTEVRLETTGQSALLFMCSLIPTPKSQEIIDILLSSYADPNAIDFSNLTSLHSLYSIPATSAYYITSQDDTTSTPTLSSTREGSDGVGDTTTWSVFTKHHCSVVKLFLENNVSFIPLLTLLKWSPAHSSTFYQCPFTRELIRLALTYRPFVENPHNYQYIQQCYLVLFTHPSLSASFLRSVLAMNPSLVSRFNQLLIRSNSNITPVSDLDVLSSSQRIHQIQQQLYPSGQPLPTPWDDLTAIQKQTVHKTYFQEQTRSMITNTPLCLLLRFTKQFSQETIDIIHTLLDASPWFDSMTGDIAAQDSSVDSIRASDNDESSATEADAGPAPSYTMLHPSERNPSTFSMPLIYMIKYNSSQPCTAYMKAIIEVVFYDVFNIRVKNLIRRHINMLITTVLSSASPNFELLYHLLHDYGGQLPSNYDYIYSYSLYNNRSTPIAHVYDYLTQRHSATVSTGPAQKASAGSSDASGTNAVSHHDPDGQAIPTSAILRDDSKDSTSSSSPSMQYTYHIVTPLTHLLDCYQPSQVVRHYYTPVSPDAVVPSLQTMKDAHNQYTTHQSTQLQQQSTSRVKSKPSKFHAASLPRDTTTIHAYHLARVVPWQEYQFILVFGYLIHSQIAISHREYVDALPRLSIGQNNGDWPSLTRDQKVQYLMNAFAFRTTTGLHRIHKLQKDNTKTGLLGRLFGRQSNSNTLLTSIIKSEPSEGEQLSSIENSTLGSITSAYSKGLDEFGFKQLYNEKNIVFLLLTNPFFSFIGLYTLLDLLTLNIHVGDIIAGRYISPVLVTSYQYVNHRINYHNLLPPAQQHTEMLSITSGRSIPFAHLLADPTATKSRKGRFGTRFRSDTPTSSNGNTDEHENGDDETPTTSISQLPTPELEKIDIFISPIIDNHNKHHSHPFHLFSALTKPAGVDEQTYLNTVVKSISTSIPPMFTKRRHGHYLKPKLLISSLCLHYCLKHMSREMSRAVLFAPQIENFQRIQEKIHAYERHRRYTQMVAAKHIPISSSSTSSPSTTPGEKSKSSETGPTTSTTSLSTASPFVAPEVRQDSDQPCDTPASSPTELLLEIQRMLLQSEDPREAIPLGTSLSSRMLLILQWSVTNGLVFQSMLTLKPIVKEMLMLVHFLAADHCELLYAFYHHVQELLRHIVARKHLHAAYYSASSALRPGGRPRLSVSRTATPNASPERKGVVSLTSPSPLLKPSSAGSEISASGAPSTSSQKTMRVTGRPPTRADIVKYAKDRSEHEQKWRMLSTSSHSLRNFIIRNDVAFTILYETKAIQNDFFTWLLFSDYSFCSPFGVSFFQTWLMNLMKHIRYSETTFLMFTRLLFIYIRKVPNDRLVYKVELFNLVYDSEYNMIETMLGTINSHGRSTIHHNQGSHSTNNSNQVSHDAETTTGTTSRSWFGRRTRSGSVSSNSSSDRDDDDTSHKPQFSTSGLFMTQQDPNYNHLIHVARSKHNKDNYLTETKNCPSLKRNKDDDKNDDAQNIHQIRYQRRQHLVYTIDMFPTPLQMDYFLNFRDEHQRRVMADEQQNYRDKLYYFARQGVPVHHDRNAAEFFKNFAKLFHDVQQEAGNDARPANAANAANDPGYSIDESSAIPDAFQDTVYHGSALVDKTSLHAHQGDEAGFHRKTGTVRFLRPNALLDGNSDDNNDGDVSSASHPLNGGRNRHDDDHFDDYHFLYSSDAGVNPAEDELLWIGYGDYARRFFEELQSEQLLDLGDTIASHPVTDLAHLDHSPTDDGDITTPTISMGANNNFILTVIQPEHECLASQHPGQQDYDHNLCSQVTLPRAFPYDAQVESHADYPQYAAPAPQDPSSLALLHAVQSDHLDRTPLTPRRMAQYDSAGVSAIQHSHPMGNGVNDPVLHDLPNPPLKSLRSAPFHTPPHSTPSTPLLGPDDHRAFSALNSPAPSEFYTRKGVFSMPTAMEHRFKRLQYLLTHPYKPSEFMPSRATTPPSSPITTASETPVGAPHPPSVLTPAPSSQVGPSIPLDSHVSQDEACNDTTSSSSAPQSSSLSTSTVSSKDECTTTNSVSAMSSPPKSHTTLVSHPSKDVDAATILMEAHQYKSEIIQSQIRQFDALHCDYTYLLLKHSQTVIIRRALLRSKRVVPGRGAKSGASYRQILPHRPLPDGDYESYLLLLLTMDDHDDEGNFNTNYSPNLLELTEEISDEDGDDEPIPNVQGTNHGDGQPVDVHFKESSSHTPSVYRPKSDDEMLYVENIIRSSATHAMNRHYVTLLRQFLFNQHSHESLALWTHSALLPLFLQSCNEFNRYTHLVIEELLYFPFFIQRQHTKHPSSTITGLGEMLQKITESQGPSHSYAYGESSSRETSGTNPMQQNPSGGSNHSPPGSLQFSLNSKPPSLLNGDIPLYLDQQSQSGLALGPILYGTESSYFYHHMQLSDYSHPQGVSRSRRPSASTESQPPYSTPPGSVTPSSSVHMTSRLVATPIAEVMEHLTTKFSQCSGEAPEEAPPVQFVVSYLEQGLLAYQSLLVLFQRRKLPHDRQFYQIVVTLVEFLTMIRQYDNLYQLYRYHRKKQERMYRSLRASQTAEAATREEDDEDDNDTLVDYVSVDNELSYSDNSNSEHGGFFDSDNDDDGNDENSSHQPDRRVSLSESYSNPMDDDHQDDDNGTPRQHNIISVDKRVAKMYTVLKNIRHQLLSALLSSSHTYSHYTYQVIELLYANDIVPTHNIMTCDEAHTLQKRLDEVFASTSSSSSSSVQGPQGWATGREQSDLLVDLFPSLSPEETLNDFLLPVRNPYHSSGWLFKLNKHSRERINDQVYFRYFHPLFTMINNEKQIISEMFLKIVELLLKNNVSTTVINLKLVKVCCPCSSKEGAGQQAEAQTGASGEGGVLSSEYREFLMASGGLRQDLSGDVLESGSSFAPGVRTGGAPGDGDDDDIDGNSNGMKNDAGVCPAYAAANLTNKVTTAVAAADGTIVVVESTDEYEIVNTIPVQRVQFAVEPFDFAAYCRKKYKDRYVFDPVLPDQDDPRQRDVFFQRKLTSSRQQRVNRLMALLQSINH